MIELKSSDEISTVLCRGDLISFSYRSLSYENVLVENVREGSFKTSNPSRIFATNKIHSCKLIKKAEERRRKHYDVIIAWAEGAEIQCKTRNGASWWDTTAPDFCNQQLDFRIKPEEDAEKVSLKRDIEKLELQLKKLKGRL